MLIVDIEVALEEEDDEDVVLTSDSPVFDRRDAFARRLVDASPLCDAPAARARFPPALLPVVFPWLTLPLLPPLDFVIW